MSGGLLVMALTATAIVTNAMFLQTAQHPQPLFASLRSAPPPTPRSMPTPRVSPIRAPADAVSPNRRSPTPAAPAIEEPEAIVSGIQRELARLGLYVGAIDGIAGSRTKAAIAAYEAAAGRPKTGAPSAELLAYMRNTPLPRPQQVATRSPPAANAVRPAETTGSREADPIAERTLYRRVQTALNRAGYGPVAADGQPGTETSDAIRRFELDNGLPVTGAVGDRLVARLVAVGAMDAL
jgi:peptidoglycan hydrolase-like protein with peptidoglycan-binding domain